MTLIRTTGRHGHRGRQAAATAGVLAVAAALIAFADPGAARAQGESCTGTTTVTCTFGVGTGQSFTVPAGVTSLSVTLDGGTGGTNGGDEPGGDGAVVTATLAVTPGETLGVDVGGAGTVEAAGGVNGGGSAASSGSGGGATDVTSAGTTLLVAGGGGGAGGGAGGNTCSGTRATLSGGAGGNADTAGQPGAQIADGDLTLAGGDGGAPGTTSGPGQGGAGGSATGSNACTSAGASGSRGAPGSGSTGGAGTDGTGGGGGGGYFGGGAGGGGGTEEGNILHVRPVNLTAGYGGGGGGASYTSGPGVSDAHVNDAGNSGGNGTAQFAYTVPAATTTTLASSANPSVPGQKVTYTATVSPTDGGGRVAFDDGGSPVTGCAARALDASGQATCQVRYTATGSHPITAAYTGDTGYAPSTSAVLTQDVVPDRADLAVALGVPGQARDGATVTETVTVTNRGPAAGRSVVTVLTEPAGLHVTGADGARVRGQSLTWDTASLAPGRTLTFTVTAKVARPASGPQRVTASARSATPDPDPRNNTAARTIRLG